MRICLEPHPNSDSAFWARLLAICLRSLSCPYFSKHQKDCKWWIFLDLLGTNASLNCQSTGLDRSRLPQAFGTTKRPVLNLILHLPRLLREWQKGLKESSTTRCWLVMRAWSHSRCLDQAHSSELFRRFIPLLSSCSSLVSRRLSGAYFLTGKILKKRLSVLFWFTLLPRVSGFPSHSQYWIR